MTQNTNEKNSQSIPEKLPVKFEFSTSVVREWQPQQWSGNAYELAVYCAISPFMLSEDGGLKFNYSVNDLEIDHSRREDYGPYYNTLNYDTDKYRGEPIHFEVIGILKPQLIKAKRLKLKTILQKQNINDIIMKDRTLKTCTVDDLIINVAKTLNCEEVFNLRELRFSAKYNIIPVSRLAWDIVRYYGEERKQENDDDD